MFYDKNANLSFIYLLSKYIWLFIIILISNSIKRNSESDIIYVHLGQLVYLEPGAENQIRFKVFSWSCRDNFVWFAITIMSSIPKK